MGKKKVKMVKVLRGGSGKWVATIEGNKVATGHIPRSAPFREVVTRQLCRAAREGYARATAKSVRLGGGMEWEIEVPEVVYAALRDNARAAIARGKAARAAREQAYTKRIAAGRCPFCGHADPTKREFADGSTSYYCSNPRCNKKWDDNPPHFWKPQWARILSHVDI